MVDVPTPGEVGKEVEEGNEPGSLGDTAAAGLDPEVREAHDIDPDPQHIQEES
jgi:hypothetical protein